MVRYRQRVHHSLLLRIRGQIWRSSLLAIFGDSVGTATRKARKLPRVPDRDVVPAGKVSVHGDDGFITPVQG